MKKIFLETLVKGNRKESFHADIASDYIVIHIWWNYTVYCRALASKAGVDMRTLDQALWQYSKEKQTLTCQALFADIN